MNRSEPRSPAWLTARPIAHRGLHDAAAGRFENTLSAACAAIDAGFAIECDVQLSRDGEAMVFHDAELDRLTARTGAVGDHSALELSALSVGGTADRIPTLTALLDLIAGRTPLLCEIKSGFDGDPRLTERVAVIVARYAGPIAIKSFDPDVIAQLRRRQPAMLPAVPLGIVAEAAYDHPEWAFLSPDLKRRLAALDHFTETDPDFLSYSVSDLPHAAPTLYRAALQRPVVTWTVRQAEQRERAARWADQIVFEGFLP